jgi:tRNA pseudouridine38-40 synthase
MRTFKLIIEYDGTDFHGWQIQPRQRTVQGELCRAVYKATCERSTVTGAGRTDAGVHAVGQVGSFRSGTAMSPAVLRRALNGWLPADIRVRSVEEAPDGFNARFDARSRTYHYIFIRRQTALWRNHYYLATKDVDIRAMRSALADLIGEKDFTTFTTADDRSRTKRCDVTRAELLETPPLLALSLTADHFLHHMVRAIAGTVLEIGRGKPWKMADILAARDSSRAGQTLPPHALYLMSVRY